MERQKLRILLESVIILILVLGAGMNYVLIQQVSRDVQQLRADSASQDEKMRIIAGMVGASDLYDPYMLNLVEKAQAEGSLTIYTSFSSFQIEALLNGFMQKYPFIKAQYVLGPSAVMLERIKSEAIAKVYLADVLVASGSTIVPLLNASLIESYPRRAQVVNAFPKGYVDPKGYFVSDMAATDGIIVNTKLPKDLWPTKWVDMTNPRPEWTGKVVIYDPRVSTGVARGAMVALTQKYGIETAFAVYKGLASTKPSIQAGTTYASNLVSTGERLIYFDAHFADYVEMAKSAPVAFIAPEDGIIVYPNAHSIMKNAPHPNAAKLYAEWVTSKDAEKVIAGTNVMPTRINATLPVGLPKLDPKAAIYLDLVEYDALAATTFQRVYLPNFPQ